MIKCQCGEKIPQESREHATFKHHWDRTGLNVGMWVMKCKCGDNHIELEGYMDNTDD